MSQNGWIDRIAPIGTRRFSITLGLSDIADKLMPGSLFVYRTEAAPMVDYMYLL